MSTGRSELLLYIAVSIATTIGLFVVHAWYGTYLDVRYHQRLAEGQPSEARLAAEEEDTKRLGSGKIPLAQAMKTLGSKGRSAASSIAPAPSEDVSAVAGWIHRPGFKPVTAHPVRTGGSANQAKPQAVSTEQPAAATPGAPSAPTVPATATPSAAPAPAAPR